MCYIVFVIFLLILLSICLRIFRNDVFSPPIVMVGVFIICATVGLLRYNDWNIAEYSLKSVLLLSVGIFSFLSASLVVFSFQKKQKSIPMPINRERMDISPIYVMFSLFFGAFIVFMIYQKMEAILLLAGYPQKGITHLISSYHLLSLFSPEKYHIPALIIYSMHIVTVNAMVCLYVLIHNCCFHKRKRKDILYAICFLYWPLYSLLVSSRIEIMVMMAMTIYLIYFFSSMRYVKIVKVRRKIFKLGSKMLMAFLAFFIVLTVFLGRKESFSDIKVFNYLTVYISAGIRNFDLFVNNPPLSGHGLETLPSINSIMYKCFGIGEYHSLPLEFRNINGQNTGNIFTCFRRYYYDFGVVGLIVIPFLLGLIITGLYYKVKRQCNNNILGFEILLFSYFARCVFFMPIEDYFFIFDVSPRGAFKIIILYFLYRIFIRKRSVVKSFSYAPNCYRKAD